MKGETTVQAVLIIKLVIKLFFFCQLLFPGAETSSHPLSTEEQGGAQQSTELCACFQDAQEIISPTLSMGCAVVSRELIVKQSAYTARGCAVNPDWKAVLLCQAFLFLFLSLRLQCLSIARQLLPPSASSKDLWVAGAVSVSATHRWMLQNKGIYYKESISEPACLSGAVQVGLFFISKKITTLLLH